eukprot:14726521-Ditylum_brightwellii.AAC.1
MSSFNTSIPQCGESYSFSSGNSSCSCPSLIDYDWDSDEDKEDSRIADGVDKDKEDSRTADGVCTESKINVAPIISWNLEDSSINLDNARSSDSDSVDNYDSGNVKTVSLLNA